MSAGERVSDLVANPIAGTAKGAFNGAILGAFGLGLAAALICTPLFFTVGLGLALAITIPTAIAVAGLGLWGGLQAGGILGLLEGTYKGIKSFFSGRDRQVMENEQQLYALREQAIAEQARTAAYLRQQERIAAMNNVNPNASDNNVTRLQSKQQSPSVTTPPTLA